MKSFEKTYVKCENGYSSVYAKSLIRKDEIIFICDDTVSVPTATKYSVQVGVNNHLEVDLSRKECHENNWQYLNHSCDPNISFDTANKCFIAISDIGLNQQLRFDYNTTEYDMAEPFSCNCGSANCYGIVSGYISLSSQQRKDILHLTADHLIEMIGPN